MIEKEVIELEEFGDRQLKDSVTPIIIAVHVQTCQRIKLELRVCGAISHFLEEKEDVIRALPFQIRNISGEASQIILLLCSNLSLTGIVDSIAIVANCIDEERDILRWKFAD